MKHKQENTGSSLMKIERMANIQDELNKIINPDWRAQEFKWEDAIMVETVELFNFTNWKWWKKSPKKVDVEQAKLEAIDIWHFILSRGLQTHDAAWLSTMFLEEFKDLEHSYPSSGINWDSVQVAARFLMEDVAIQNTEDIVFPQVSAYIGSFATLLLSLGMSINELYVMYIGKVQLNKLRWANDYGGNYIKIWNDGKEDNVWLSEYTKTLDSDNEEFPQKVLLGLQNEYKRVTSQVHSSERSMEKGVANG